MPGWLKAALALLLAGGAAYWWLFVESPGVEGQLTIDLAEVRRLSKSQSGDLPTEVRVETIGQFEYPSVASVAGAGWSARPMGVFSYQLVYPTQRVLIDTATDEATALANDVKRFDREAVARIVAAMNDASLILVTHEHFDHIGGLAAQPNLASLLIKTRLTTEQAANVAEKIDPGVWPPGVLAGFTPLDSGVYFAVAPGVVLIKLPGHTPGSQALYVQRADGVEYLFTGDVAWLAENIERIRGRAPVVSRFFLKEDRGNVLRQLAELHRLALAEPALHLVPGHDPAAVNALVSARLLSARFQVP